MKCPGAYNYVRLVGTYHNFAIFPPSQVLCKLNHDRIKKQMVKKSCISLSILLYYSPYVTKKGIYIVGCGK